ncbi:hypothetical protein B0H13DRAFT_1875631 [Mycena leptocephala]|nr:hypothetical protein B0H13DRAFT_1875631 [Mycena leptocephala]
MRKEERDVQEDERCPENRHGSLVAWWKSTTAPYDGLADTARACEGVHIIAPSHAHEGGGTSSLRAPRRLCTSQETGKARRGSNLPSAHAPPLVNPPRSPALAQPASASARARASCQPPHAREIQSSSAVPQTTLSTHARYADAHKLVGREWADAPSKTSSPAHAVIHPACFEHEYVVLYLYPHSHAPAYRFLPRPRDSSSTFDALDEEDVRYGEQRVGEDSVGVPLAHAGSRIQFIWKGEDDCWMQGMRWRATGRKDVAVNVRDAAVWKWRAIGIRAPPPTGPQTRETKEDEKYSPHMAQSQSPWGSFSSPSAFPPHPRAIVVPNIEMVEVAIAKEGNGKPARRAYTRRVSESGGVLGTRQMMSAWKVAKEKDGRR